MFGNVGKYMAMRANASKVTKSKAVTEAQLRSIMKKLGMAEREIGLQVSVVRIMGGEIVLGDCRYSIKAVKKK